MRGGLVRDEGAVQGCLPQPQVGPIEVRPWEVSGEMCSGRARMKGHGGPKGVARDCVLPGVRRARAVTRRGPRVLEGGHPGPRFGAKILTGYKFSAGCIRKQYVE